MRRRSLCLTFLFGALSSFLLSQTGPYAKLLLPAPVTLSGVVVDPNGTPIQDVQADHHNLNESVTTDNVKGVSIGKIESDVDYRARWFSVKTKHGRKAIQHGIGPFWSFGIPLQPDVWESVEYSERSHLRGGISILDARGKTPSGKFWRYLGILGESASYHDLDESEARLLDEVLNGVCLHLSRE